MHDSDVLLKNIVSTLRNCVLLFQENLKSLSSLSERDVRVTGQ